MEWDDYFFSIADKVKEKSKDRSTKVGCVIVGPQHEIRTTGFNGFCRGVDDDIDSRHERPEKYLWTEHAERNAIYNAARNGIVTESCSIYIVASKPVGVCSDCARAIIQSGIKSVHLRFYSFNTKAEEKFDYLTSDDVIKGRTMFEETNTKYVCT